MTFNLDYTEWREQLRVNAAMHDRSRELHALGDGVLRLFYERGCDPTIRSIVEDCEGTSRIA